MKSGIKTEEKVYERVGRLKQKYPSVSRYYQIDYSVEVEIVKNRKTKENMEVRKVKVMSWKIFVRFTIKKTTPPWLICIWGCWLTGWSITDDKMVADNEQGKRI